MTMTDTAERPAVTLRRYARAISALQAAHAPVTLYAAAEGCGHQRALARDFASWDKWHDDHPPGDGLDGEPDSDRICRLTPAGSACPACSALLYGVRADEDDFVAAADCIVLPVIEKALSEDITDDH